MARVGIGTVFIGNQWFDYQPQGEVPVLSTKWWDLTVHAVSEGRRVGVDIGMFNCPGWSQSGGPWVTPEQSMRYLASSEVRLQGPTKFSGVVPTPGEDFQDVALLAYPAPKGENEPLDERRPEITSQPPLSNPEALVDGDRTTTTAIPSQAENGPLRIDIVVDQPFTARSVVFTPGPGNFRTDIEILAWVQGEYQSIRRCRYDRRNPQVNVGPMPQGPVIASLPPTKSARYRIILSPREGSGTLAEIEISPAARLELVVEKQLGKVHPTPTPLWGDYLWPETPEPEHTRYVVDPSGVVNLSQGLAPDGRLDWEVPEGEWILQRIGMMPTGTKNSPAAPYATGLEVDKMNRVHLKDHFDAFIGELLRRLSPADRPAFKYVVADSYEMGPQNWTDGMRDSFQQTYEYDPLSYLPVLSGRVVGTAEDSDRFLWDLRRFVADRVAEDYVGGLRDLCQKNHLQMWLENYGHWGFPGEFMRYGGQCDLIGGEFWVTGTLGNIECRAAAATAHAYGKRVVYGEAFTSGDNWVYAPRDLKARGDWAFTEGINHFVLHVNIHQPSDDFLPGMNAWFGTEFNRHNTWFEEGKDWVDYLRRCHVLLQQGIHVGDFAYFIGEDTPIMTGTRQPVQPPGYDYDFVNAEVLLERMEVKQGRWTLPDGKSYAVLVLAPLETMRPAVLKRLRNLVSAGGVLYGNAPRRSPSLQGAPDCDTQIQELAQELWQGMKRDAVGRRSFGKGHVFQGGGLQRVVDELELLPDVSNIHDEDVLWTHRQTPDGDIYFLSNQKDKSVRLEPVFRVDGSQAPEFWHADTGRIELRGEFQRRDDGVRVPVTLGPTGSLFVVFRRQTTPPGPAITTVRGPAPIDIVAGETAWQADVEEGGIYTLQGEDGDPVRLRVAPPPDPLSLGGPWRLHFPAKRDVPNEVALDKLMLWTDLPDQAIRHFSGSATYRTTFRLSADRLASGTLRHELRLEHVQPMARVILNEEDLGLLWYPPYRVDVTNALRPGENVLDIRVTNLWSNRLVGELKHPNGFPGRGGNRDFSARSSIPGPLTANRPLQPSGLGGPVRIHSYRRVPLRSTE
jgi:hypothetical protein